MNPFESIPSHEQHLVDDLKRLLDAAQDFVQVSAHESGEKLADARKRFQHSIEDARHKVDHAQSLVLAKAKVAAASTDAYVRSNPWKSVGIGAAAGVIVGMLIGRR
jgi:ElaB/YqjD/DUF883 family membrane-anchored ribosome-binding protein